MADLVAIVGDAFRVASVANFHGPSLGAAMVLGGANSKPNMALAAERSSSSDPTDGTADPQRAPDLSVGL